MKINEQDFKTFELTGEQEVFLDKIVEKFDNDCSIYQWRDEYRLFQVDGIKCTIPKIQAIQLIDLLKLSPVKCPPFKNATTWRLENVIK